MKKLWAKESVLRMLLSRRQRVNDKSERREKLEMRRCVLRLMHIMYAHVILLCLIAVNSR